MPDAGTVLDVKWRFACHQAAVSRVLTQRALSVQSREVYRLATVEGLSNNAVAKRLGMSAAAVRMSAARSSGWSPPSRSPSSANSLILPYAHRGPSGGPPPR